MALQYFTMVNIRCGGICLFLLRLLVGSEPEKLSGVLVFVQVVFEIDFDHFEEYTRSQNAVAACLVLGAYSCHLQLFSDIRQTT